MSAQGKPEPADPESGRLRWLGRGVVVAVVVGLVLAGVGVLMLVRSERSG